MSDSQTTTDLDAQIAKLEEKLNELLDKVQKAQTAPEETSPASESTPQTIEEIPQPEPSEGSKGKSRQEILAEYEKGYLARLEENERAQEEIRRASAELEAKKEDASQNSTRGSLPKGF